MNVGLYFLVFGESLFNDGVTVVLYNTMIALVDMTQVGAMEILMAFLSFFCVVLGKYYNYTIIQWRFCGKNICPAEMGN